MGCENLAGMKFAHLLVLKRDEMKKSTHSYWLCQCDCGTICSVAGTHLKTGHTKSCGCYRKRKYRSSGTESSHSQNGSGRRILPDDQCSAERFLRR